MAAAAAAGDALTSLLARVDELELRDRQTQQHVRSLRSSVASLEQHNQRLERALSDCATYGTAEATAAAAAAATPDSEPSSAAVAAGTNDKADETTPDNDDAAGAFAGHMLERPGGHERNKEPNASGSGIVGLKRRQLTAVGGDDATEGSSSCSPPSPKRSRVPGVQSKVVSLQLKTQNRSTLEIWREVAELLQGRGALLSHVIGQRPQHVLTDFGKPASTLRTP